MNFIKLHLLAGHSGALTFQGFIFVSTSQICSISECKSTISKYAEQEILNISSHLKESDIKLSEVSLTNGSNLIVAESIDYIHKELSKQT